LSLFDFNFSAFTIALKIDFWEKYFTSITLGPLSLNCCLIPMSTTGFLKKLASIIPLLEFPTSTPQFFKKPK